MAGNERLAALMTEAGFLDRAGTIGRKRFARAVNDTSAARQASRRYNHTYVSRWLAGVTPRDEATRDAIREALATRLGRRVSLDELGFRVTSSLCLPTSDWPIPIRPDDGVTAVAELLEADLAGATMLKDAITNVAAWNDASLAWLVGAQHPSDRHRQQIQDQQVRRRSTTSDAVDVRPTR